MYRQVQILVKCLDINLITGSNLTKRSSGVFIMKMQYQPLFSMLFQLI